MDGSKPVTNELQRLKEERDQLQQELQTARRERDTYASAVKEARRGFEEKISEFSLVKRISDELGWTLEPRRICTSLIDILIDETTAETASLWLADHEQTKLYLTAVRGQEEDEAKYFEKPPKSIAFGSGAAGHAASEKRSILIEDVAKSPLFEQRQGAMQVQSLLCIPITGEERVHGVLNLSHPRINAFSRENERILQLITDQAAMAFANAANFAHIKRLNDDLERIVSERTANLRQSEQRYQLAAAAGRVGIWDWSRERNGFFFSENFLDMAGLEESQVGRDLDDWLELLHEDDRESLMRVANELRAGKCKHAELELRMYRPNGELAWFMLRGAAYADEADGPITRVTGSVTDITDRKLAESALAEAQEKALANARAAGKAEFANSVLHNIGNVLSSVNVGCDQIRQLLAQSKLEKLLRANTLVEKHADNLAQFLSEDEQGRYLGPYLLKTGEMLEKEHENLREITQEMLGQIQLMSDIIKTQQADAKAVDQPKFYDLATLVEESLKIQMAGMKKRRVQLIKRYPPHQVKVFFPKARLTHILVNIIKNGCEAMMSKPPGERVLEVRIEVESDPDRPRVIIQDSGRGIHPEVLPHLFTHGFTTKSDGHGFGLSYCRRTMKEYQGDISVASEGPIEGATFELRFYNEAALERAGVAREDAERAFLETSSN